MPYSSSLSLDRSFYIDPLLLSSQSNKPSYPLVTAHTTCLISRTATQSLASSLISSFLPSVLLERAESYWRYFCGDFASHSIPVSSHDLVLSTKIQHPWQQHAAGWHMLAIFSTQPIHPKGITRRGMMWNVVERICITYALLLVVDRCTRSFLTDPSCTLPLTAASINLDVGL